jgi:peroxiredoxin
LPGEGKLVLLRVCREGNIAKIMRKVKPAEHADDVLAALP